MSQITSQVFVVKVALIQKLVWIIYTPLQEVYEKLNFLAHLLRKMERPLKKVSRTVLFFNITSADFIMKMTIELSELKIV